MQLDKFEIFPPQEEALWCAYSLKLKSYCKSSLQHSESNENSINWSKKKKTKTNGRNYCDESNEWNNGTMLVS